MKPLAQERAPVTHIKGTRSERIDAVVVCSDDTLLIEIGPLLGDHFRTHTVDIPADIAGRVEAERWIGIVDVDGVPDAPEAVARLELQYPHCPLILVASRPQDWAFVVARGAALAAISRDEVAHPRLSEALVIAREQLLSSTVSDQGMRGRARRSPRNAHSLFRRPGMALWIGAALLLVAWAAIGSWLHVARPHPQHTALASGRVASRTRVTRTAPAANQPPISVPPVGQPAPSPGQPGLLELLSAARVAFRDQKLLLPRADGEPRGDSALELYVQVLKQDPQNDEALDGMKRLFVIGRGRIQSDVTTGKLNDAGRLLALFRAAGVQADALQELKSSLDAARPKWLALRAQQNIADGDFVSADQLIGQLSAAGADPAVIAALRGARDDKQLELQLTRMAAQVNAAIHSGALLQPADDNARTRLTAMRNLARTHPLTLAAQSAVHAALLQGADAAMHTLQFDLAQRYLGAAADLGSAAQASDAKRQLQTAMSAAAQSAAAQQAQQAQQAAQVRGAAAVTSAATNAQAAAASSAPQYLAARPTRALHARYPDGTDASGYVIVEFTLAADGSAHDASVVQSSPSGIFDRAALDAVSAGRYDVRALVDGRPSRARILMRFKPN